MASGGTRNNYSIPVEYKKAPAYFMRAVEDMGLKEWVSSGRTKKSNPVVEDYIKEVIGNPMNARTTPWCAFWVGAMLKETGHPFTRSGMARSYLKYGVEVKDERDWKVGDIVVFWRGRHDDGVTGHVAFYLCHTSTTITVLGGNQADEVNVQEFSRTKLLAVRRPRDLSSSRTIQAAVAETVNSAVLKPVVEALPDQPAAPVAAVVVKDPVPVLEKAQAQFSTVTPLIDALGEWKPVLKVLLYAASTLTILAIIYFRWEDFNSGKNN